MPIRQLLQFDCDMPGCAKQTLHAAYNVPQDWARIQWGGRVFCICPAHTEKVLDLPEGLAARVDEEREP